MGEGPRTVGPTGRRDEGKEERDRGLMMERFVGMHGQDELYTRGDKDEMIEGDREREDRDGWEGGMKRWGDRRKKGKESREESLHFEQETA